MPQDTHTHSEPRSGGVPGFILGFAVGACIMCAFAVVAIFDYEEQLRAVQSQNSQLQRELIETLKLTR